MGIIFFLIIVLIIAGYIFINVKISNLKYRTKQHILKDSGISSSEINAGIIGNFEKKHLEKFLEEHENFTEDFIKDLLRKYTVEIFNRNSLNEFSQAVNEKMEKDSKLEKMQTMEFRRANINYYGDSKLNAMVVYTDNKDEYNVYLTCNVIEEKIQVEKYQISKGAVVGF